MTQDLHIVTHKVVLKVVLLSIVWLMIFSPAEAETPPAGPQSEDHTPQANPPTVETAISEQARQAYRLFMPIIGAGSRCNFFIEPRVSEADTRVNYKSVKAGDVVCIRAGSRDHLVLKNFTGAPGSPITFINLGGQVLFNQSDDFAIKIQNSRYLRLTGTGDSNTKYGIKVNGGYTAGVRANYKSSDIEIDHLEIANTTNAGIYAKTEAVCPDGSTNNYDYDGDGKIKGDLDDVVYRNNFTQYNTVLHDNYLHNIGKEGFYVGSSFYTNGVTMDCASGRQVVFESLLSGVNVYKNIIEQTGWDGIQVSSAYEKCNIHHNRIYHDSQANEPSQRSGIGSGDNSPCQIYNNFIKESGSKAIRSYVYGSIKIYNNIIVSPGMLDSSGGNGIWIMDAGVSGSSVGIWNNTIINPKESAINIDFSKGTQFLVQNNLVVISSAINLPIETGSGNVTLSNNFVRTSLGDVQFTDPNQDNYSLRSNSPAIDAGVNLSSQGITSDFADISRPQGSQYDLGAYEFVGTPTLSSFATTP